MIQFLFYDNSDRKIPDSFLKMKKGYYIGSFKKLSEKEAQTLKKAYPYGVFRLSFWEQGGFFWDNEVNKAQIVCDEDGYPLVPVVVKNPKKENIGNKQHGLFISYNTICTVIASKAKTGTRITITKHTIDKDTGFNDKEILWEGNTRELVSLPETAELMTVF